MPWKRITDQQALALPPGTLIRDVEDSDCYFEGITQGAGTYRVTRTVWCGEESVKQEEDGAIGLVIHFRWWHVEIP